MESKISKLKGIHSEFRHCITYPENGSEVAVQTFLDSFGRTVYGTLGTRGFSRVRREFSVLAEGRHNFGRRPKPRAATALERTLAPRLCVRRLPTCFAALLRNGFKSHVALFTTYVQTRLHKAGCYKLRDYWLLIFSQPPTTFWFVSKVWFVSGQTRNIAIQVARFAAIMLQNRSHVFVACFTVP